MVSPNIAADGVEVAVASLIAGAAIVWLALVWWTYVDVRRRVQDPRLVRAATALALVPFVGPLVYMIVRPAEYLADAYEREISIASSEKLIEVLSELQHTQREIHASVKHLESALNASRRRAAARQAAQAPPTGGRQ